MQKAITDHLSKDPKLAAIIAVTELTVKPSSEDTDVYTVLLNSIVSQQLSVKAASTIFKRFLGIFPDDKPYPEFIADLSDEEIRAVGLSRQKAGYIRNVARYWQDHNLDETDWDSLTDVEILNLLTPIKGVGKWTVEMLLMFSLRRPDVFAADDLGIQQGMTKMYNLEEKGTALRKRMIQIAEAWRPYRTYACRYIWRYKDTI